MSSETVKKPLKGVTDYHQWPFQVLVLEVLTVKCWGYISTYISPYRPHTIWIHMVQVGTSDLGIYLKWLLTREFE